MTHKSSVTKKGQITIPKKIRDSLGLDESKKVIIELKEKEGEVIVRPSQNFVEVARNITVEKPLDPLKAREYMEKHYERF